MSIGLLCLLDYAGHPFQAQLSRALAARGHQVLHVSCATVVTGQGRLSREDSDPSTLRFAGVGTRLVVGRGLGLARLCAEIEWGFRAGYRLCRERPSVVVLTNLPLICLLMISALLRFRGTATVIWQQDIHAPAIAKALGGDGLLATGTMWLLHRAEALPHKWARHVITISNDFVPVLRRWGIAMCRITVIPNWAPLEELPVESGRNSWTASLHPPLRPRVALYSGTLGYKHNPNVLLDVAASIRDRSIHAELVVISEGLGRQFLDEAIAREPSLPLRTLDYVPYEQLAKVLASADVLLVILERDAGKFSVPSKVLTYLCAGRAIVGLLPGQNAAAATIRASGAGLAIDANKPESAQEFVDAVLRLICAPEEAATAGHSGRIYAERLFDIESISDNFQSVLEQF